jgi:hypothetical protein
MQVMLVIPVLEVALLAINYANKRFKGARAFGLAPGMAKEPPKNR